jgi:hypothetical protein
MLAGVCGTFDAVQSDSNLHDVADRMAEAVRDELARRSAPWPEGLSALAAYDHWTREERSSRGPPSTAITMADVSPGNCLQPPILRQMFKSFSKRRRQRRDPCS